MRSNSPRHRQHKQVGSPERALRRRSDPIEDDCAVSKVFGVPEPLEFNASESGGVEGPGVGVVLVLRCYALIPCLLPCPPPSPPCHCSGPVGKAPFFDQILARRAIVTCSRRVMIVFGGICKGKLKIVTCFARRKKVVESFFVAHEARYDFEFPLQMPSEYKVSVPIPYKLCTPLDRRAMHTTQSDPLQSISCRLEPSALPPALFSCPPLPSYPALLPCYSSALLPALPCPLPALLALLPNSPPSSPALSAEKPSSWSAGQR